MRKIVIGVIIISMFSYAVYDYLSSKQTDETDLDAYSEESLISPDQDVEQTSLIRGSTAPDFALQTLTGETVRLSDFHGQKVMLNFWATWCGPCRAEMPDMQKFYDEKDIVVLAVNLTTSRFDEAENVEPFVDEYGLTFPILLDVDNEVADLYQIKPIPTSFLIDTSGKIHNVAYGALNYELMVQEFEKMN